MRGAKAVEGVRNVGTIESIERLLNHAWYRCHQFGGRTNTALIRTASLSPLTAWIESLDWGLEDCLTCIDLMIMLFAQPGVTQCDWQDVKIQLLTNPSADVCNVYMHLFSCNYIQFQKYLVARRLRKFVRHKTEIFSMNCLLFFSVLKHSCPASVVMCRSLNTDGKRIEDEECVFLTPFPKELMTSLTKIPYVARIPVDRFEFRFSCDVKFANYIF